MWEIQERTIKVENFKLDFLKTDNETEIKFNQKIAF
jgi:hypothetical protein